MSHCCGCYLLDHEMEEAGEVSMTVEGAADAALVRKEVNHSQLVDRNKLLASGAMLMSSESEWQDPVSALRRTEGIPDVVDSKIEVACANSKAVLESDENLNDDNAMVEELTLKNYKSPNLLAAQHVNSREEMPFGAGWHHYVQLAGGSSANVIRSNDMLKESLYLGGEEAVRASGLPMSHRSIPSKQLDGHGEMSKNLSTRGNYVAVGGASSQSSGGIRTKAFSMSGFHRFFVKKSSKGRGTLHASQKAREGSGVMVTQDHKKMSHAGLASNASHGSGSGTKNLSVCNDANANIASLSGGGGDGSAASVETSHEGLCLRECLMEGCQKVNKVERLLIFREILELVTQAHLRGTALQKLRPSYFLILPSKNVRYIGSWSKPVKMNILDGVANQGSHYQEHGLKRRRFVDHASRVEESTLSKHQKLGGYGINVSMQPPFTARHGIEGEADIDDIHSSREQSSGCGYREELSFNRGSDTLNLPSSPSMSSPASMTMNFESVQLEERWYASPEELSGRTCTLQSNIYSLGVLFFELFCYFESWEMHTGAMFDLRHRILPPNFLSESAKEAGFCLWLLHPEPSSRPKASEILESEMINEVHHVPSVDDVSLAVDDDDAESELLLHFLLPLKEKKQKQALKLVDDLGCLREDIEKVERRNPSKTEHLSQTHHGMDSTPKEYLQKESVCSSVSQILQMNEARLMRNIRQLEHAYFSMRSQIALPDTDVRDRVDKDVLKKDSRLPQHQNDNEGGSGKTSTDRVGAFFEGIYKYARYSRFETRGILRNGDFLTSGNVICSLSFDRDEDYFAAAGVSKKIKIFEFSSLLNDMVDIHYPVIEMASKAKLSCVCWNNYIKNYLASTDYDGVVQLWDASTGQGFTQYAEHQKRAWSVDFSRVDPTKLASGSDDCSVKLWSINEKKCLSTIRSVANICCVQFSSHSTHMLAFGSSDYKIYCYDLRNPRIPWCTLVGHKKAVSYVKFLDSETLVSASTDNTIKIWDLNNTTSGGLSTNACSLSVSGHTNEKNFVGLSVSDGYIACGSETNEVFAYYRSLPMPITSYKFGSIDPISGQETGDDNGLFVSSVCWRGKSNTVVAANSNGCIKLLQLV